ncbi:hypothetical protein [Streptomyces sp. NPDC056296]|uniref:hypothetical protein n=1 Tax=Streptomyces sp. NPDC056296 TaxID=3345775 RepID=UPI0035DECAE7
MNSIKDKVMHTPEIDMDLDEFREILSDALKEGGTQHLLRLTDEEIAVLDPDSLTECVAPTPRLGELSAQEREWAYATALRSLVSREAVEVGNIDELDSVVRRAKNSNDAAAGTTPSGIDLDLRITPELSLALTLRRTATQALAVEQNTSGGATHALVYVHSVDLYLVERVTSGGLHAFTLASSAEDAAQLVQMFVDPFDVADKDGPTHHLTPEQISQDNVGRSLTEAINGALVVSQVVLLADRPGPLLTTYATDRMVWTVFVEAPNSQTGIQARPVGKLTLKKMISQLLIPENAKESE